MQNYRWVILGAGPAGLTFANKLKENGENSFIVLERESEAGGLCRSKNVDGFPLDIGGGHFLDVRRPKANEFLFQFMPEEEWDLYVRNSKISLKGMFIDHPIEANIWEMDIDNQIDYLKSIATAGCNRNVEKPERFVDWIYWKLGTRIAEDYMLPYNRKIFSSNLNELGTYWMDKLPNVSFENTLRSCLEHRAFGEEPGHAQFYYPKKYGYGEVWNRMAEELGPNIQYGFRVRGIDFEEKIVWDHNGTKIRGENIITTIPWQEFRELKNIPLEIKNSLLMLKQSSIQVEYVPGQLETDAHWIYYPEEELAYHRILVRHNFCPGSKGYWTETNCERLHEVVIKDSFYNQYAYPLNTIEKPQIMKRLISWAEKMQIFPLGRWGEHQHYNSDVTVVKAIELFEKIGI